MEQLRPPKGSPPPLPVPTGAAGQGDSTGGVIPYNNPNALLGYYLGILSGLPIIGLPFGIAAFVLGIKGLQAVKKNPAVRGTVHAAIGIGCGGVFAVTWALAVIGLVLFWLVG